MEAPQDNYAQSKELDYSQKLFKHPSYNYTPIYVNTFGQTIGLGASQIQSVFNLPPEVFNLSKSYLQFTLTLGAMANNYIWQYEDVLSGALQHIQLYSNSNEYLVDLDNLNNYMKAIKKDLSYTELETLSGTYGLSPSNSVANAVPALRNNGSVGGGAAVAPSERNYTESSYFSVGQLGQGITRTYNIPLNLIKNSFFAIDKDIYFGGQISFLRIYWAQLNKICYASANNANPSLGIANPQVNAYNGVATVGNVQLMLAMESNTDHQQRVKAEFTAGKSFMIPYPQSYKNSNNGGTQTISIQLDLGLGEMLQKVYHQIYNNFEVNDTAYDCSNNGTLTSAAGGGINAPGNQKVLQFYTQLNGIREQNLTMDCTGATGQFTDYMQMKKQLNGSILKTLNEYQYNWVWCSDYNGFGPKGDQEGREQLIAGIPMGASPLTWSFYGVTMTAAMYQHFSWMVFTRRLNINSKGAFVGNNIKP